MLIPTYSTGLPVAIPQNKTAATSTVQGAGRIRAWLSASGWHLVARDGVIMYACRTAQEAVQCARRQQLGVN